MWTLIWFQYCTKRESNTSHVVLAIEEGKDPKEPSP